jgi:hypothetical protein
MRKTTIALTLAALFSSCSVFAAEPTVEQQIAVLQQEIEALKTQMIKSDQGNHASGLQGLSENTTIGGYGNINYNNYSGPTASGAARNKDQLDLQRFVLFFGHKFNDTISMKSELEIEHAVSSNSDKGEVEVEQLYLDFHFNDNINAKAGLFLIPIGLLNESHEPPTFFGVERNEVETRIIPTTFREAGVGAYGQIVPGLNYQLNFTTTFDISKLNGEDAAMGIGQAHQEGQFAVSEDYAISGALNYNGIPGVLVGAAFYTGDTGQNTAGIGDARFTLVDVHGRYNVGNFDIRALYTRGFLSDAANIKTVTGFDAAKEMYGWYTEAAYHIWKSGDMDLAPFVRYENYDTQASLPANSVRVAGSKNNVWTVGASFWPAVGVVLKADYQVYDKPDEDKGDKRLNIGLGYMF